METESKKNEKIIKYIGKTPKFAGEDGNHSYINLVIVCETWYKFFGVCKTKVGGDLVLLDKLLEEITFKWKFKLKQHPEIG